MPKPQWMFLRVPVSLAVAAVFVAAPIAYYMTRGEERELALTGGDSAVRATMARTEAERWGAVDETKIQAAPRTAEPLTAAEESAEATAPSPPDGYSFVSYYGEMPRVRIAGGTEMGDGPARAVPDWMDPATSIDALVNQASGAGRDWSLGWIRLAEDAKPNDVAEPLSEFGATVLGSSGNHLRAQLPGNPALLEEIAALPEVGGLGGVPPEEKLPEGFAREVSEAPPQQQIPVFITLMTDDPDGRWRWELEDLGAVVGRFDPDLRTYTANVAYGQVEAVAAADYVLAVEPIGIVWPAHDTAVPAMGADALRAYGGTAGIFSGMDGASVPIGVMDTGLNINHMDIASNRESICGANFVWSTPGPDGTFREAEDLWIDEGGHGTHITGTIAGNGSVQPRFAGMAPGVRHIRFAKVLAIVGGGSLDDIMRAMDFMAAATECAEEGRSFVPVKPLIVNMSLAASSRRFAGRGTDQRKLDSVVWSDRQLYVVANANKNIDGYSNYGAAKNSLSVGAVLDSGDIASFSSHGPTFDGRLVPQVVATGVRLHSAVGDGSRGGYRAASGTSMASPTVAGVAALLMDAAPEHREHPALARARLMAGAIRPDAWLDAPNVFSSTNTGGPGTVQAQFGLGKVSARTSILNRDTDDGWIGGGATSELNQNEYAYQDIEVPEGASRLDLVMTWDEPPADAIASTVLNDLDLWLDRDGDCGEGDCGEHSSASRVDNVEWIILKNPRPGTYRAKVVARRVYTAAPRAALAWTVIRGESTPNLRVETDRTSLGDEGEQELTVSVTADEYVAAGSRLHVDCRPAVEPFGCNPIRIYLMDVSREDGVSVDLSDDFEQPILLGSSIPLGEIAAGETQEVRFVISSQGGTDAIRLHFTASAWNAKGTSASVEVGSDGINQSEAAQRPAHDDFASAAVITGEQGSHRFDLLLATPEPGEPRFLARDGRPAGSVWYRWTAPADDLFRFEVSSHGPHVRQRDDRIDIFRGDRISDLESVASDRWGTVFFAEKSRTYRVRVSNLEQAAALILQWLQASRPVNDDFANATLLEGTDGDFEGTSRGATLEPDEWFGPTASTTWYRWTAPNDGRWRFFTSGGSHVLVFEGDGIASLRLVSQYPSSRAGFSAQGGKEYRIAVNGGDDRLNGPYTLWWNSSDDARFPSGDNISGAERINNGSPSQHRIFVGEDSTVEPGEPPEAGVRTNWWVWDAPSDGSYTWRLTAVGEGVATYTTLLATMFTGTSTDDLQLVAQIGPDTAPSDFVMEAAGGQRYWISAGFRTGDISAYSAREAEATLVWGRTPGNDRLASAEVIPGTAGSVSGSNRFATLQRGERGSVLGHSSVWWTYEAAAAGWQRFWLDDSGGSWVLTIYRQDGDEFGGLDFVRSSHQPEGVESDGVEVIFHAEEGDRYTIRLGGRGRDGGGEFTMHWGETEAPVWLKFAGRLADGDVDADGTSVQFRGPSGLALNDDGKALYAASRLGLQVFERDPSSGELTIVQTLEDDGLEDSSLIWDPHRDKLYAHRCGAWRRFAQLDETRQELEDEGTVSVIGDPPAAVECGAGEFGDLFMDQAGSFLNVVFPSADRLQVLALGEQGGLRHVQTVKDAWGVKRAVISNDGSHVYAVTDSSLLVFRRNSISGRLTQTAYRTTLTESAEALAVGGDGGYLFVFDDNGGRTRVFLLEDDPANPRELGTLPPFWSEPRRVGFRDNRCRFARVRKGIPALDVFCTDMAFGVEWRPESGFLAATDHVASWQADRFHNPVLEFGHTRNLAASPDGRHAYLDTEYEGLVIFERVGAGADPYGSQGLFSIAPVEVNSGPVSSDGFIGVEDVVFDKVHDVVVSSRWQRRAAPNGEWSDLPETETAGELCAHTPTQSGEYRLVADIRIDGRRGRYSSNTIRW